jgi:hypothetical protein
LFTSVPVWPEPNARLIDDIVSENDCGTPGLQLLRARSAVIPRTAAEILGAMFAPETLICVGLYEANSLIAPIGKLTNLERFQFICPNPMRDRFVLDPNNGRRMERCLANVLERRFIVVDFDLKSASMKPVLQRWASVGYTPQDGMAALITIMEQNAPLVLVVFSGNISLQAWFYCAGVEVENIGAWFTDGCLLGADPAGWVSSQYFRMPGATRKKSGKIQEIVYFNPGTLSAVSGSIK